MAITPKSGERNRRKRISGMEAAWTKMWDPPIASPTTPETVPVLSPADPYYNPVPAFMAVNVPGYNGNADHFVERALLGGITLPTWDNQINMRFMAFEDPDAPGNLAQLRFQSFQLRFVNCRVEHLGGDGLEQVQRLVEMRGRQAEIVAPLQWRSDNALTQSHLGEFQSQDIAGLYLQTRFLPVDRHQRSDEVDTFLAKAQLQPLQGCGIALANRLSCLKQRLTGSEKFANQGLAASLEDCDAAEYRCFALLKLEQVCPGRMQHG